MPRLTLSCVRPGLAVLADMLLTTHFMALVMLTIWRLPLVAVVAFYFVFAPIEATYWSSTLEKIPTGAGYTPALTFELNGSSGIPLLGCPLRARLRSISG